MNNIERDAAYKRWPKVGALARLDMPALRRIQAPQPFSPFASLSLPRWVLWPAWKCPHCAASRPPNPWRPHPWFASPVVTPPPPPHTHTLMQALKQLTYPTWSLHTIQVRLLPALSPSSIPLPSLLNNHQTHTNTPPFSQQTSSLTHTTPPISQHVSYLTHTTPSISQHASYLMRAPPLLHRPAQLVHTHRRRGPLDLRRRRAAHAGARPPLTP